MNKKKIGICLGKFMPLHLGHEYLINTAIENCEQIHIVVCTLKREPIDGELRYQWMLNRYKEEILNNKVVVHHLKEDWVPQEPEDCYSRKVFYGTWAGILKTFVGDPIDVIFTSEDYGYSVAEAIGCEHILVDKARKIVPISGTAIRNNPIKNWQYMNEDVRKYFTKKVLVIGTESTGKSTLTRNLANYFDRQGYKTKDIQEYAREWINSELNGDMDKLEFDHITHFGTKQMQLVEEACNGYNQIVFSDTDAIVSTIFQRAYYGCYDNDLNEIASKEKWDLILFTQPDVPWVDDGQRNLQNERQQINKMFEDTLRKFKMNYIIVEGNWEERFRIATDEVNKMIYKSNEI